MLASLFSYNIINYESTRDTTLTKQIDIIGYCSPLTKILPVWRMVESNSRVRLSVHVLSVSSLCKDEACMALDISSFDHVFKITINNVFMEITLQNMV